MEGYHVRVYRVTERYEACVGAADWMEAKEKVLRLVIDGKVPRKVPTDKTEAKYCAMDAGPKSANDNILMA